MILLSMWGHRRTFFYFFWQTFIVFHAVAPMTEIVVLRTKKESCWRARSSDLASFLTPTQLSDRGGNLGTVKNAVGIARWNCERGER